MKCCRINRVIAMSLTDLKRKQSKKQGEKSKKTITVDEFIEDANAYARGQPTLAENKPSQPTRRDFKNATFTLSPENIEQLSQLATQTGLAKSKIVRELINLATTNTNVRKRLT